MSETPPQLWVLIASAASDAEPVAQAAAPVSAAFFVTPRAPIGTVVYLALFPLRDFREASALLRRCP